LYEQVSTLVPDGFSGVAVSLPLFHPYHERPWWRVAEVLVPLPVRTVTVLPSRARQVGDSGSFALSAAFKRVRGISPQQHRAGEILPERQEDSP
jgi:hypothetical protein